MTETNEKLPCMSLAIAKRPLIPRAAWPGDRKGETLGVWGIRIRLVPSRLFDRGFIAHMN